jgi:spore coat protein U-like protein
MLNIFLKGLLKPLFLLLFIILFTKNTYSQTSQVNINAVVIAGSRCTFQTNNATINLGNLIPGSGIDVSGTATLTFRCQGKSPLVYSITDDDGLWESSAGIHRMRHQTLNEFIIYNFNYTPSSETITDPNPNRTITINRTLSITATALHSSYQNASIGSYTDTVTLTILP